MIKFFLNFFSQASVENKIKYREIKKNELLMNCMKEKFNQMNTIGNNISQISKRNHYDSLNNKKLFCSEHKTQVNDALMKKVNELTNNKPTQTTMNTPLTT